MAPTAQILTFPLPARPIQLALAEPDQIGLALVLAICERCSLTFDKFYREHPGAVYVGDAAVDRDVFARWAGIAA